MIISLDNPGGLEAFYLLAQASAKDPKLAAFWHHHPIPNDEGTGVRVIFDDTASWLDENGAPALSQDGRASPRKSLKQTLKKILDLDQHDDLDTIEFNLPVNPRHANGEPISSAEALSVMLDGVGVFTPVFRVFDKFYALGEVPQMHLGSFIKMMEMPGAAAQALGKGGLEHALSGISISLIRKALPSTTPRGLKSWQPHFRTGGVSFVLPLAPKLEGATWHEDIVPPDVVRRLEPMFNEAMLAAMTHLRLGRKNQNPPRIVLATPPDGLTTTNTAKTSLRRPVSRMTTGDVTIDFSVFSGLNTKSVESSAIQLLADLEAVAAQYLRRLRSLADELGLKANQSTMATMDAHTQDQEGGTPLDPKAKKASAHTFCVKSKGVEFMFKPQKQFKGLTLSVKRDGQPVTLDASVSDKIIDDFTQNVVAQFKKMAPAKKRGSIARKRSSIMGMIASESFDDLPRPFHRLRHVIIEGRKFQKLLDGHAEKVRDQEAALRQHDRLQAFTLGRLKP